jgi:hypothetical protein
MREREGMEIELRGYRWRDGKSWEEGTRRVEVGTINKN